MSPTLLTYGSLFFAVAFETVGTSFLKQSEQFSKLLPGIIACASYLCSFYLLSISLRTLPVGIAYAIWSGVGIVLISLIGVVAFKQSLDMPAYIGIDLIIAGVMIVNLFSKAVAH